MKKLSILLISILSLSAQAECPSVDMTLKQLEVGMKSQNDLVEAVKCNLEKATSPSQLCATKLGLLKDTVAFKQRQFDYGMISKLELATAKSELSEQVEICK